MNYLTSFLLWLNRWSIDVALGAGLGSYGISQYIDISFSFSTFVAEFSAVLCIYNFDHWIDSKKNITIILTKRRSYYLKNQDWLLRVVIISIFTGIISLFYIDKNILFNGIILSLFMIIYFIFNYYFQKKYFFKEFFIALFYTLGIHLPFIQFLEILYSTTPLSYFFISFSNLILFTIFEEKENNIENTTLFYKVLKFNFILHFIFLIISIYFNYKFNNIIIHILFFVLHIFYFLNIININYFIQNERFRYLCDNIFIILGLLLCII